MHLIVDKLTFQYNAEEILASGIKEILINSGQLREPLKTISIPCRNWNSI